MAKRGFNFESQDDEANAFVGIALDEAQKVFGPSIYVATDDDARHVGIPIPNIALQWLLQSNVWPLSKLTLSGGEPASHKSAFSYQLILWYLQAGGMAWYVDTENKHNAPFMWSIIPEEYKKKCLVMTAGSVEEWQQVITKAVDSMRKFTLGKGVKPTFPALIVIDSMLGSETENVSEKIDKEGSAGRSYPEYTLLLNTYFKALASKMLLGMPMTVHTTNHEKIKANPVNPSMPGTPSRQGGRAPDFHASVDLRFKRTGAHRGRVGAALGDGTMIEITVRKNSYGADKDDGDQERKLTVPFLWIYEPVEGTLETRQRSWWDWNYATALLIYNKQYVLKSIIDLKMKGAVDNKVCWSSRLGIEEDDAVPLTKIGELVHSDKELTEQILGALNVHKFTVFAPGSMDWPGEIERIKTLMAASDNAKAQVRGGAKKADSD